MTVLAFNFSGIEAKRGGNMPSGEIKVNSTPTIVSVEETDLPNLKKKGLDLTFEFVTTYEPDMGSVTIRGNLLYLAEKHKDVLEQWKSKKSLPDAMWVDILNFLFRRCLVKITSLADDLQLPPPVALPRAQVKQEGKKDTGYVG